MNKHLIVLLSSTLFLAYGCGSTNNVKTEQQKDAEKAAAAQAEAQQEERHAKTYECINKVKEGFSANLSKGILPQDKVVLVDISVPSNRRTDPPKEYQNHEADLISASKGIAVVDIPWSYGEIMIRQYGSVNGIAMAMNAGAGMPPQVERNVKIPVTAVEPRSSAYRHCE